ncbi:isocitrate lyase/PEP mutase family protein [Algirhabdus cladophorae]|uniref:isocitrate lyase/PEP mutase family protein n=1 Tax=Algirhabdus cladophorae TaxID=3377108 RepID=UPI003B845705
MTSFRDLHQKGNPFTLINVWDKGSAQVMAALGAQALATSSSAHGFTLGRPDQGHVSRDESLAHAQDILSATDLPVSGDFENGFGHDPETCAETVRLSAEIGLAGICIEDESLPDGGAYEFDLAVERVKAASSAARACKRDFFFVARADGMMNGRYDIDEAIRRLKAFETAGADGLYAPLPPTLDDLKRICAETSVPVNVLAAGPWTKFSRAELAATGVARISLGSAFARTTYRTIVDAGQQILTGDFKAMSNALPGDEKDALLAQGAKN